MPKMKTNRSAAKRFKATGSGKFTRQKAYRRHLLTHKARARKRSGRGGVQLSPSDAGRVKRMLPHF